MGRRHPGELARALPAREELDPVRGRVAEADDRQREDVAVDRLHLADNDPRFEVIYLVRQGRAPWAKLHLKTFVSESSPELPSLQPVWKGADWWERYVFDFYGIRFQGHPNLRRVLLYEEFQGHPLRKDYPLRGRQPLTQERTFPDAIRGPGSAVPRPESAEK